VSAAQASDEEVCRLIASVLPKAVAKHGISPEMNLRGDLAVDSLGLMSIVFVLEEKLGIDAFSQVDRLVRAEHVSDLIAIVRQS
jgi:acyl carrier protein